MTQTKTIILNELLDYTNGADTLFDLYQEFKDHPSDTLPYEDALRCYDAIASVKRDEEVTDKKTKSDLEYSGYMDEDGTVEDSDPDSDVLPSERFFGASR